MPGNDRRHMLKTRESHLRAIVRGVERWEDVTVAARGATSYDDLVRSLAGALDLSEAKASHVAGLRVDCLTTEWMNDRLQELRDVHAELQALSPEGDTSHNT
jgi:hypothetical protein